MLGSAGYIIVLLPPVSKFYPFLRFFRQMDLHTINTKLSLSYDLLNSIQREIFRTWEPAIVYVGIVFARSGSEGRNTPLPTMYAGPQ